MKCIGIFFKNVKIEKIDYTTSHTNKVEYTFNPEMHMEISQHKSENFEDFHFSIYSSKKYRSGVYYDIPHKDMISKEGDVNIEVIWLIFKSFSNHYDKISILSSHK